MTENIVPEFPGPDELPEADILIFDGHCSFCQGKAKTLKRLMGAGRLAFLSLHDPEVQRRFPDLTYDRLMKEMVLVDQRQRRHGGAEAVRYLSRKTPWLWPLALLLHIPGTLPLWQRLYQWVAVRRYRLSHKQKQGRDDDHDSGDQQGQHDCENGTCAVHFKQ